jgi:hypothetical protein
VAFECPRCSGSLEAGAAVCKHCLLFLGRDRWRHDAGRLGADDRGAGRPLEDPPVGPIPIEGSGLAGGTSDAALVGAAANSGFRLFTTRLLGRRRQRG